MERHEKINESAYLFIVNGARLIIDQTWARSRCREIALKILARDIIGQWFMPTDDTI